jgi:hypothetical protein
VSSITSKTAVAAGIALAAALSVPALAQDSFTQHMLIGGDDPTFPRNASRHYEIVQITVTDPAALNVTVSGTNHGGQHRFVLTTTDYVLPDANRPRNVRQIAREPDAIAWQQVRRDGSRDFRDGPSATPLAEGQYQMFVGVSTRHDRTFTMTILGARLGWGPSIMEEIAHLSAASSATGRATVDTAHGVARTRGQASLVARDEALSFTRSADPETGALDVTRSTMGGEGLAGNVYAWVELTGFRAENERLSRNFSGRGLQIGADFAIGPDMVAGLSFGAQDTDSTIGAVDQEGILRFAQPYIAYRSGAWSGEATLVYGLGDYTQTSTGGTGTGETRLAAITFTGGYDIPLDTGLTVTPTLGLAHGVERIEGRTGTLAGAGRETVSFTQASIGAEFGYAMGGTEVFAGLHADWLNSDADTALVSDLLVEDGWTGRVELGLSTELGSNMLLDTTIGISGLGGDMRQTSGSLRFAIRF